MAKKKIKAELPLLAFGLPQRPGHVVELEEKQASEIVEAGYAKFYDEKAEVKAKKEADAKAEGTEEETK